MEPPRRRRVRDLLDRIIRRLKRRPPEPEAPGDPYAYVTAPKRPRPPHRSGAAVAELDE